MTAYLPKMTARLAKNDSQTCQNWQHDLPKMNREIDNINKNKEEQIIPPLPVVKVEKEKGKGEKDFTQANEEILATLDEIGQEQGEAATAAIQEDLAGLRAAFPASDWESCAEEINDNLQELLKETYLRESRRLMEQLNEMGDTLTGAALEQLYSFVNTFKKQFTNKKKIEEEPKKAYYILVDFRNQFNLNQG